MGWKFELTGTREAVIAYINKICDDRKATEPRLPSICAVIIEQINELVLDQIYTGVSVKAEGNRCVERPARPHDQGGSASFSCGYTITRAKIVL